MPHVFWRKERWAAVLAVLSLAILALMAGQPYFTNASRPPRELSNPLIAIETVHSVPEVDYILGDAPSSDREVMRIKLYEDLGLAAALTALFLALGWIAAGGAGIGRVTGPAAMVCAAGMAVFEVMEKLAIRRLLDVPLAGTTAAMLNAIRSAGAGAWTLTGFTLALLAGFFLRRGRWSRIAGALALLTAVMQLYGLRDNRFLEWQVYPASAGLALVVVLFWRPRSA